MVLIFSTKFDQSTNNVIDWLEYKNQKVIRLNSDDERFNIEFIDSNKIFFRDKYSNERINLLDANSCWWRRTGIGYNSFINSNSNLNVKYGVDISSFTSEKNKFFLNEFTKLREYIYYLIYKKCKINLGKPIFDLNRLVILDIAKECGLDVPNFQIITNSAQLQDAKVSLNKIVSKAISNGLYEDKNGYRFYTYTESIDENFLKNKNLNLFPSLAMQLIKKKYEIRSFYLDNKFYSMAIFSQSDEQTKIDFRKYSDNRNEPYQLPGHIELKLKNLFKKLNLNSGSIDLILDESNRYIFLEINPVGQYGMTSFPCNYNLEEVIANYLIYGTINS